MSPLRGFKTNHPIKFSTRMSPRCGFLGVTSIQSVDDATTPEYYCLISISNTKRMNNLKPETLKPETS